MNSPTGQSAVDHQERKIISAESIYAFGNEVGSPEGLDKSLDGRSVAELAVGLQALKVSKSTPDQMAANFRKYASKLCSLGTMEACECFLKQIGIENATTPSIAKYGLTTIANCTASEDTRMLLMKLGAGEFIVQMLKNFGEEHYSVAQYGIISITNLTSNTDIRNTLGSLQVCQLIVKMLKLHAFKEAPHYHVAVYGLYAIGKLSLNHDQNRQRFGACGGCEEVVEVLKELGAANHTITDYGMYALAHLAYFNMDNKKRLSNSETYKVIMELVRAHGKDYISIASFGLTAVSNLIHTETSKDKFGALGMCELVQELGQHYKMAPEALANNVIFTIGKLAHKHTDNAKALARGSVGLVVQSLQTYGAEKVTQAGNGLFALSALVAHHPSAIEKITNSDVVELIVALMCIHAVDDASIAIYGVTILEAVLTHARGKGESAASFLHRSLVNLKIGTLAMHLVRVYAFNEHNCNVEVLCRAVSLIQALLRYDSASNPTASDTMTAEITAQLRTAQAEMLLQRAIVNNVLVMEKHTNDFTLELLGTLRQ